MPDSYRDWYKAHGICPMCKVNNDILKATLEDIDEEIRGFEERIQTLSERLEERRQKQAYLRDFIRSM